MTNVNTDLKTWLKQKQDRGVTVTKEFQAKIKKDGADEAISWSARSRS